VSIGQTGPSGKAPVVFLDMGRSQEEPNEIIADSYASFIVRHMRRRCELLGCRDLSTELDTDEEPLPTNLASRVSTPPYLPAEPTRWPGGRRRKGTVHDPDRAELLRCNFTRGARRVGSPASLGPPNLGSSLSRAGTDWELESLFAELEVQAASPMLFHGAVADRGSQCGSDPGAASRRRHRV